MYAMNSVKYNNLSVELNGNKKEEKKWEEEANNE
jgi:hypothetical protein